MSQLPAPGAYQIDQVHSQVGFVTRHLVASKVRGSFTEFEGTVEIGETAEASKVSATVPSGVRSAEPACASSARRHARPRRAGNHALPFDPRPADHFAGDQGSNAARLGLMGRRFAGRCVLHPHRPPRYCPA